MDLSKLPRLSKTEAAAPSATTDPPAATPSGQPAGPATSYCNQCGAPLRSGARFCDSCGAPAGGYRAEPLPYAGLREDSGVGPEVWISLALGALFLFIYPRFIQWVLHPGRTDFDAVDSATGAAIPYAHSAFIWQDGGVTLFAVSMILEGLVLAFARRRPLVLISFGITCLAIGLNLWAIVYTTGLIGFPIVSALAIVFGGYIAFYEWRVLQSARAPGR